MLPEPPLPPLRRQSARQQQAKGVGPDQGYTEGQVDLRDVMFLEYMPRGSLDKAIKTASDKQMAFPNRALWHMFHCLVKACIGMAFPPERYKRLGIHYRGQDPPFREELPGNPGQIYTKDRYVHFDIDPQNVLVGDDNPETGHHIIPLLKLSDFGLASDIPNQDLSNHEWMLSLRRLAKYLFFTPEQFTDQWDTVPRGVAPGAMNPRPSVAGNFSWKTNLYQMGLTMMCLITKEFPPQPPHPRRIHIPPIYYHDLDDDDADYMESPTSEAPPPEPGADEPSSHNLRTYQGQQDWHDALFDTADMELDDEDEVKANWIRVWTYGGHLMDDRVPEYVRVDRELRRLVAQCLCNDPRYRPRMAWLDRKIAKCIRERYGHGAAEDAVVGEGDKDDTDDDTITDEDTDMEDYGDDGDDGAEGGAGSGQGGQKRADDDQSMEDAREEKNVRGKGKGKEVDHGGGSSAGQGTPGNDIVIGEEKSDKGKGKAKAVDNGGGNTAGEGRAGSDVTMGDAEEESGEETASDETGESSSDCSFGDSFYEPADDEEMREWVAEVFGRPNASKN
ncbi:uncharacterized protein C8A04DRAFT_31908 [Dichotomopilus funicola]|uniref:Protein kinase domain-containing protein n=1 Tax=Dichotomopilus funicola TaxID=1934379 RepID=A0AAN6ZKC9_9PEZI|nr:hypothetical protein C8A04DRAFT_31908 [Dichotomopilus funicola]